MDFAPAFEVWSGRVSVEEGMLVVVSMCKQQMSQDACVIGKAQRTNFPRIPW
jgi:hypothetical protein